MYHEIGGGYNEGMRHYLLDEVKITAKEKPVYQTEFEHDATVTIKEGKAHFPFYTADSPSSYHVVIEGVSTEGNIFRKVGKLF